MKLDTVIGGLLGVAFGLRALDDRRAWWARAAYGAVGFDLLSSAWKGEELLRPASVGKVGLLSESSAPLKFKEHKVRSIQERVAYIHEQMVRSTRDPDIYKLARETIRNVPEKNSLKGIDALQAAIGEVEAVHLRVQDRVRYTFDPLDYDAFQTARKTWELRTGDCDDMIILEGAMLRTIGIPFRTRVVQTRPFETWNHIYGLAKMPNGKWIAVDPIMKDKRVGWQVPREMMVRDPFDADVVEKGAAPKVPSAKAAA